MTVASTVSTLPLSVILLTTPASVMMTATVIQKTSVMKPMAYVRLQFAWQTQNAMDSTKFAMLSMTTASTVERMIVLPIQMAAVQVISPLLQPIHNYKSFLFLGCHDSGLNCEYPAPVCDLADHTCKCNDDSDCHAEDFCNTDGICEEKPCVADADCNDEANGEGVCDVSTFPHGNCYYCDRGQCKPGI